MQTVLFWTKIFNFTDLYQYSNIVSPLPQLVSPLPWTHVCGAAVETCLPTAKKSAKFILRVSHLYSQLAIYTIKNYNRHPSILGQLVDLRHMSSLLRRATWFPATPHWADLNAPTHHWPPPSLPYRQRTGQLQWDMIIRRKLHPPANCDKNDCGNSSFPRR